jgi:hypothetical protein
VSTLQRINPSEVPGLFRRLDIKPVQGVWGGENCGCLLVGIAGIKCGREGALKLAEAWEETGASDESMRLEAKAFDGFDRDYITGLAYGWDNSNISYLQVTSTFTVGYQDGRAAARACGLRGGEAP